MNRQVQLKNLANGKNNCDRWGIPVDLYTFLWTNIKHIVINSITNSFAKGMLSINQRSPATAKLSPGMGIGRDAD